jgi:ubiquinone biosynthesis protein UbiJ
MAESHPDDPQEKPMADIFGVLALNQAQFQQQLSITLLKQNLEQQEQVAQLIADSTRASSGNLQLNAEGLGQVINKIT